MFPYGLGETNDGYTECWDNLHDFASKSQRLSPEHVTIREVFFLGQCAQFFSFTGAAQRIAIAAYAQGAIHCPLPSAVGKVPGDAEYRDLYMYAMESVCP